MLELEMVNECYNYLRKKRGVYLNIVREVPFLSRCIDLVLLTRDKETIAIEFKIKNWRQAIEQAKNHMLGADKVYICLPQKKLSKEMIEILEEENIGLFLYCSGEFPLKEYIPAPMNFNKINIFNNMLLDRLKNISELESNHQT